jgi:hypothetical protein
VAPRSQLARAPCEAAEQAQENGDSARYKALFDELRRHSGQCPKDPEVAEAYVQATNDALRRVTKENAPDSPKH